MSPYITSFFLVFAGMLIGYFLWYRDRSSDEALRESLARDNEDMRTSIKLAHNSHEQLDERFTRQKGQLNVLQQLCDDWSNSREQAERDRAKLEIEVAEKQRRCDEAISELQDEKERRVSLEDKTHHLTQLQITKLSEMEEDWRTRHAKIESSLFQRQADLKSASGEKDRLATQLHQAESRIAELQSDSATQKSLLETATKNASGLEQEYVSVESSLMESSELLKGSRAECAAALSAQKVAEESLEQIRLDYESAQNQIEELQAKVANMDSLESQVHSLQEACSNSIEQLETVSTQRDLTMESEKRAIAQCAGLQKRIDNQEATIHGLREKHDDAMENLKSELGRRSELEVNFEQKSAEMLEAIATQKQLRQQAETLQRESGDLSSRFEKQQSEHQTQLTAKAEAMEQLNAKRKMESTELQNRIAMQTETIQQLTQKREAVENDLAETTSHLTATTVELDTAKQQTSELTLKVEELKTTCLRISELEKLVQQRDQDDQKVVEELRTLREQYAESFSKQQELQMELDRVSSQWHEMESDTAQHDRQLEMLQTKLKASERNDSNATPRTCGSAGSIGKLPYDRRARSHRHFLYGSDANATARSDLL